MKASYHIAAMAYVRVVFIILFVAVLPLAYLSWADNQQMVHQLRNQQVAGCERRVADSKVAIMGWSAAREARLSAVENAKTDRERELNQKAANVYHHYADIAAFSVGRL